MPIGHSFIELESVDSTNNYAMAQAHAGAAPHGTQYFAYEQWAGKGQRGRVWASNPGENIVLSTVLQPIKLSITQGFALSTAVALACWDLFSRYAGEEETRIKWPNDLYWRDRKAGGILLENSYQGEKWSWAIAGTGINVNQIQFPETSKIPVSLKQITGRHFDAVALAKELGQLMEVRYTQLEGGGSSELLAAYNERLFCKDVKVRLKKDSAVFETIIQGVDSSGQLLTRDVIDRRFGFGEVEWIF